jgi:HIV Tat-specific factor 1
MEAAQSPTESWLSGFPQSPSEFDADPRIAFSKVDDKFLLETEEGAEFEWDGALRRWIPVVGIAPLSHHHRHEEAVPPLRTRS